MIPRVMVVVVCTALLLAAPAATAEPALETSTAATGEAPATAEGAPDPGNGCRPHCALNSA